MYSERERLASAIWKIMEPALEAAKSCGQPMSIRFDAQHRVCVDGVADGACEIVGSIAKAEEEYSIHWDIKTISIVAKKAAENKNINVEWVSDSDTGVYIDWSEYFKFSV